jgi:hypothetical protein
VIYAIITLVICGGLFLKAQKPKKITIDAYFIEDEEL